MVVGLARLDGQVVGIVANQPQVRSGAIFVDSADKAARFITLCDAFNMPLLFLHDVPGFMVGRRRRAAGDHPPRRQDDHRDGERRGARSSRWSCASPTPPATTRCAPPASSRAPPSRCPTATIGPMAAEASVNAMYAKKIAEIADPEERAAYVADRTAEQQADIDLLRVAERARRRRGRRARAAARRSSSSASPTPPGGRADRSGATTTSVPSEHVAEPGHGTRPSTERHPHDRQPEPAAVDPAAAAAARVAVGEQADLLAEARELDREGPDATGRGWRASSAGCASGTRCAPAGSATSGSSPAAR